MDARHPADVVTATVWTTLLDHLAELEFRFAARAPCLRRSRVPAVPDERPWEGAWADQRLEWVAATSSSGSARRPASVSRSAYSASYPERVRPMPMPRR